MAVDPDDTVRLPARRRWGSGRWAVAALAAALAGAAIVWVALPRPVPVSAPTIVAGTPTSTGIRELTEAELNGFFPDMPTLVRLRENAEVFPILFPDLETQAAAMNRLAALVEKADLPRDRLLTDRELADAIARGGDTPATWYLGHDYRGADVARFLALANAGDVRLNAQEAWLGRAFAAARSLVAPEREIALISVANPDARFDAEARAAILRHEIGHGYFFTRPGFATHVRMVWAERFTEAERSAFRGFLKREGYDSGNEELMANEAMAYLLFTPDPRFFAPPQVGLSEAAVEAMRAKLRQGAPPL